MAQSNDDKGGQQRGSAPQAPSRVTRRARGRSQARPDVQPKAQPGTRSQARPQPVAARDAAPAQQREGGPAGPRGPVRQRSRERAPGRELSRKARYLGRMRWVGVRLPTAAIAVLAFVGLLFFARPTTSDIEKRALAKLPEPSLGSVLDGSYLSELSLWYGDTYPLREPLVRLSQALKALYGIQPKVQLVGGSVVADELPAEGEAAPVEATPEDGPVEAPTERGMAEEVQDQIMQGLYVDNGAAYNIYYFSQESVQLYAEAMNTCAANLAGEATVYSIIAPTSAGALLDEGLLEDLGGTDQRQAIRYFLSLYSDDVHGVDVYDALRAHRDEYLYFRTDHHWTQLGAYYAYLEFCKAKGVEPSNILAREKMTFDTFLGTFYAELGNTDMEANPDYVDAYIPNSTNDMVVWDTDGNEIQTNVVTDVSDWNIYSKYNCFISGDRPLSRIDNPTKTDGSSCLVIKDSFGCAFVPLLVDDYQTVWVIDFRYSDRSIPDFVRENDIEDVIFLNAIVLAGTDPVASSLLAQAQNGEGSQG